MRNHKLSVLIPFLVVVSTGWLGCSDDQTVQKPAAPIALEHSEIGLAIGTEFSRLDIPDNSRPEGAKPP